MVFKFKHPSLPLRIVTTAILTKPSVILRTLIYLEYVDVRVEVLREFSSFFVWLCDPDLSGFLRLFNIHSSFFLECLDINL